MSLEDVADPTQAVDESDLAQTEVPNETPPQDDKEDSASVPIPDPSKAKPVGRTKDGSVVFDNGVTLHPTGTITFAAPPELGQGSTFFAMPGQKQAKLFKPPAPKAANTVVADETGPDGVPYKVVIDKDKLTSQRVQGGDPGSRAAAQQEMLRMRMINAAKSQPAIAGYINVKNNYDSLAQNSAIPPQDRTPADDAAAIQAFGAIEHPGTGVTDADKKQAQGLVPIWDKLSLHVKNWTQNKANTLTPDVVNQMRDAAKRALDGRQKTYNEQLQPLIQEAQRVGLHPAQVNGALGANVADYAPPAAPTQVPAATPTTPEVQANSPEEYIAKNQGNPDPAIQKKVQDVKDALDMFQKKQGQQGGQ